MKLINKNYAVGTKQQPQWLIKKMKINAAPSSSFGIRSEAFLIAFTFRDAECDPSNIRRELMALRLAACTFTV
jgi:hypothetical protein